MNSDGDENIDEIKMEQVKNFDFDENIFGNSNTTTNTQEVRERKKIKGKKNKGMDFMEYAKNNGISINIEYEDNTMPTEKKYNKKEYNGNNNNNDKYQYKFKKANNDSTDKSGSKFKSGQNNNYIKKNNIVNSNNKLSNNDDNNNNNQQNEMDEQEMPNYDMHINMNVNEFNNNSENNYDIQDNNNNIMNDNVSNKYKNKSSFNYKAQNKQSNNNNNNNYVPYNDNIMNNNINPMYPYQHQLQYMFNNSNNNNTNNNNQQHLFNQYSVPSYQQHSLPFPPPPHSQYNHQQQFLQHQTPYPQAFLNIPNTYIMEIINTLELIFSLENLNFDINLRVNLNENGWINSNVLISFYPKLFAMNVTPPLLYQILKSIESRIVECAYDASSCSLFLRNKNFNYIQNSLLSIDAMKIQNAKMYSKNLNMNMKQSNNSFYYNNMLMQMGQNLPQMMMNQNGNMVHY